MSLLFQMSSNQLMQMNKYTRRVQVSMDKLSVPSWYKPPDTTAPTTTHQTSRWRLTGSTKSLSTSAGWRRHLSQPQSLPTCQIKEKLSKTLYSEKHNQRAKPEPSKPSQATREPYLGWRHQTSNQKSLSGPMERMVRPSIRSGGLVLITKNEI